jgi:hypothetical protein
MTTRELRSAYQSVVQVQVHDLSDTLTAINLAEGQIHIGRPNKKSREAEEQNRDRLCAMLERNAASLLEIAARLACGE